MAALIKGTRNRLALEFRWAGKVYRPSVARGVRYTNDNRRLYAPLVKRVEVALEDRTFDFKQFFPDCRAAQQRPLEAATDLTLWGRSQVWLEGKNGLRAAGYANYAYVLSYFLEGTPLGKMDVRTVRRDDIQAAIAGKPARLATIFLQKLRKILLQLVRDEVITKNVADWVDNPPKSKREIIDPVSPDDQVRLITAAQSVRDRAMVQVGFALGLRPQELVDIHWRDIDFERRRINIRGTKTEGSDRTIDLPDRAAAALRRLPLPIDGGRVFCGEYGTPITLNNWRKRNWEPLFKALGAPYRPPNVMRHSFAVDLLNNGQTPEYVSRQMGHTNPQTLYRYYARWMIRLDEARTG